MTTPLSKIIKKLENNHQQDIKNSAVTMAVTADMLKKQEFLVETLAVLTGDDLARSIPELPELPVITKEDCIKRFGNFKNTYQFYKDNYRISCPNGWNHLLPLIQNLQVPQETRTIEERLENLERSVTRILEHLKLEG